MIHILRLFTERRMRRGFAQLEQGSGVLLLTEGMARAYDRDTRSYAARRAYSRAEARRIRNHRLQMEVSALVGAGR